MGNLNNTVVMGKAGNCKSRFLIKELYNTLKTKDAVYVSSESCDINLKCILLSNYILEVYGVSINSLRVLSRKDLTADEKGIIKEAITHFDKNMGKVHFYPRLSESLVETLEEILNSSKKEVVIFVDDLDCFEGLKNSINIIENLKESSKISHTYYGVQLPVTYDSSSLSKYKYDKYLNGTNKIQFKPLLIEKTKEAVVVENLSNKEKQVYKMQDGVLIIRSNN